MTENREWLFCCRLVVAYQLFTSSISVDPEIKEDKQKQETSGSQFGNFF